MISMASVSRSARMAALCPVFVKWARKIRTVRKIAVRRNIDLFTYYLVILVTTAYYLVTYVVPYL